VAEALLGYHGEQCAAVASELALLFEAGRDFARAADSFMVAAQNAARVYANQEAAVLLGRALANAEKLRGKVGQSRTLAAALQRAPLYMTLSRFDGAIADCERAEKAAGESGNREAQIDAVCGKAWALFFSKRLAEMEQCGNRAAEFARRAESRVGIAAAEGVLAGHRLCTGDLAAAEGYLDRAMPVLKEEGAPLSALDAVFYRSRPTGESPVRQPCLECPPASGTVGMRRSLCFRCYKRAKNEVSKGHTTWAALEKKGLALPARTPVERFSLWRIKP
jgi:hypothetical protein